MISGPLKKLRGVLLNQMEMKIQYTTVWDIADTVLGDKCLSMGAYVTKSERSQIT